MDMIKQNTTCLACGSKHVHLALNLGDSPLANSYKDSADHIDARYPLAVNLCYECFHLQLSHTVDPAIIYKNYMYATGTNNTIHQYCEWFADFVREYNNYHSASTVLDIGCNDGTQLDYFAKLGYKTFGIDPAENLHDRISSEHVAVCDFFGPESVDKLKMPGLARYDIITAQNVFAHNPNPVEFLQAVEKLMHSDTLLFIQTSQADMVLHNEFDTIYHEHINFFNALSMSKVAQRAGLYLVDVIKTPIHGNSYIFVLRNSNKRPCNVDNILAMERAAGLYNANTYQQWNSNVQHNVLELCLGIKKYREQGYHIVGYGAAAKGMTLLNFSGIELDFIIDDSPLKQGKFAPGTAIPIVSIGELSKIRDDEKVLFIPLAWNFFDEIKERILNVRRINQDRFLRYFPEVTTL
jgi:cyclopropane fatty-acyl-phospholipid synthase-like methyltransferase